jgi:hypothetical protein
MGRGFVCGALTRRRAISLAGARIVYSFGAARSPRMTCTRLSHVVPFDALRLASINTNAPSLSAMWLESISRIGLCATDWRLIGPNIAREITRAHRQKPSACSWEYGAAASLSRGAIEHAGDRAESPITVLIYKNDSAF